MKSVNALLDSIRKLVRKGMHVLAGVLNRVSNGRIQPSTITLIGVAAHVPIAWLIATGHPLKAALLLVVFGLFDALDGELARLQKSASPAGMLLDASTDRLKEIMLYTGIAYFFDQNEQPGAAIWAVMATGGSLLVSYVKAKGETAVASASAGQRIDHATVNRMFQDGLMRFEVRMATLIVGLLLGQLDIAVFLIAVLSLYTALQRLRLITQKLRDVQD